MRILVADKFPEKYLKKLRKRDHDVRFEPGLDAASLPDAVADAEVLVVRSTEVSRETFERGERLGLVVRAGAGTNTIDVETASARSVLVSNIPGRNAVAVAELAMGLMLALDRRIPDNVVALRQGEWRKTEFSKARGLMGRHLGVVGLGSIGFEVAQRARAFGMKVWALERGRSEEQGQSLAELGVRLVPDLETMLPECDFVSLHLPSNSETRGLVDAEFLDLMRDEACLINTSRGDLIVTEDLLHALDEKPMWAALDVFPDEPEAGEADFRSPLAQHPRVYGTHHIGASTEQAQEAIAKQVVKVIDGYSEGEIRDVVNLADRMRHTTVIGIRHVDKVGVLSQVFSILRRAGINVEHMVNHVFAGATAAKAIIHIEGEFDDALRKEIAELDAVFDIAVLREMN